MYSTRSNRTVDLIANYVTDINNKCGDLDIKKLQGYLKKHNGQSSEDYLHNNSYCIGLLFTKSDFNNKNVMNAKIISHHHLQYGYKIDITKSINNTFQKIALGISSKNRFCDYGTTAGVFSLSMKNTFNEIISKIVKIPKKFYTTYKNINFKIVDSRQESGKLIDISNTNFFISNVSVNKKEHILLAGYININTNASNNIITSLNDKEVIEAKFPFASVNRKSDSKNEIVYKISLPYNSNLDTNNTLIPEYVYTMQVNGHFTVFEIDTINMQDNISKDIQNAESHFFNTNFVYDTTWTPRIIPTIFPSEYKVKCHKVTNVIQSSDRISVSLFTKHDKYDYIYIKFTMDPNTYVVGTLNIIFSDIYPATFTNYYDDFKITVSKEEEKIKVTI